MQTAKHFQNFASWYDNLSFLPRFSLGLELVFASCSEILYSLSHVQFQSILLSCSWLASIFCNAHVMPIYFPASPAVVFSLWVAKYATMSLWKFVIRCSTKHSTNFQIRQHYSWCVRSPCIAVYFPVASDFRSWHSCPSLATFNSTSFFFVFTAIVNLFLFAG